MDRLLTELEQLTEGFIVKLDSVTEEEFDSFVTERGRIIYEIQGITNSVELRPDHKEQIQRILRYDELLLTAMHKLKSEAGDGLKKMDAARLQRNAYETNYSMESAFVDKRK